MTLTRSLTLSLSLSLSHTHTHTCARVHTHTHTHTTLPLSHVLIHLPWTWPWHIPLYSNTNHGPNLGSCTLQLHNVNKSLHMLSLLWHWLSLPFTMTLTHSLNIHRTCLGWSGHECPREIDIWTKRCRSPNTPRETIGMTVPEGYTNFVALIWVCFVKY